MSGRCSYRVIPSIAAVMPRCIRDQSNLTTRALWPRWIIALPCSGVGAMPPSTTARPCGMDRLENGRRPPHALSLGDADGPRASKLKHAVEDVNGNGNFGHATPIRP